MNSKQCTFIQRIANCSYMHHLATEEKTTCLKCTVKEVLSCHGMILSHLGQIEWLRHGTSNWPGLNMGVNVSVRLHIRIFNPSLWILTCYTVNAGMLSLSAMDQILFGSCSCDVLHMQLVPVIADNKRDSKLQNMYAFIGVGNLKDKICSYSLLPSADSKDMKLASTFPYIFVAWCLASGTINCRTMYSVM
jgi:hypothetical protein